MEKAIGFSVQYFAYPKGRYIKSTKSPVEKAGYAAAFGVGPNRISAKTNIYAIPRISVDRTHSIEQFKAFFKTWGRAYLVIKKIMTF